MSNEIHFMTLCYNHRKEESQVMEKPFRPRTIKILAAITGIYGIYWIAAEGELYRAAIMGCLAAALPTAVLLQRLIKDRSLDGRGWILIFGGTGLLLGVACALLTLIAMVLKTGLHGHGPEFTQDQLTWVVSQMPVWGAAGLIGGLGLGVLGTWRVNRG